MKKSDDSPIGIICGGGEYPRLAARACVEKGIDFRLVFLKGFCSPENWPKTAVLTANFGEVGRVIDFLKAGGVRRIVFAGKVTRPNFNQLLPDKKGKSWLLKLGKNIFAGDDALLRAVTELLHEEGFEVIAGTGLLDDIFLPEGIFSLRRPTPSELTDIKIGLSAAAKLGLSDVGQSVIVRNGKVIGEEDAAGTDALAERCAFESEKGGILVKISKPQQDDRLDLPTVGIQTVETLRRNNYDGLAIEANRCIVINKEEVIRRADESGIFIVSVKPDVLKIFLIAGEASGDYLGGRLMQDISKIFPGRVDFFGVGGQYTEKAGLKRLFSVDELSVMGIAEVIGKIFHVKKLIDKTVQAICEYRPDVIVTVDSSGFTHRVVKRVKKIGYKAPTIHYVAPPVWAWRPWRARSIHKFIDKLLVLFPFEPPYFRKYGPETVFVGHPIASDPDFSVPPKHKLQNFLNSVCKIKDKSNCRIITLLPGSRKSEVARHLPVLEEFTRLAVKKYKNVKFLIPTVETVESDIRKATERWLHRPIIVTQKSQKILSFYASDAAVAASGTATLELARTGLPFVAVYKTSPLTYMAVKLMIRVSRVCIVNLLAEENTVPELLQSDCTAENILRCVEKISDPKESRRQKKAFAEIIEALRTNPESAAREIINAAKSGLTSSIFCAPIS
ncbi:MAG: lipid-A-disaccharide synthase [Holosporaceae bacterium]|jgi:lipid-A-disaccharide synthase|nr:lipid-A-disaccharide synthase [Holosporaceae bacterium]